MNSSSLTKRRRVVGFTLVELMIALTITAMLLAALAAAVNAAMTTYQVNQDMSFVSVASRNALRQMCSTIRSGRAGVVRRYRVSRERNRPL